MQETRFFFDGAESYHVSDPGANAQDYSLTARNFCQTSDLVIDWIRARALITPEPSATLGSPRSNK